MPILTVKVSKPADPNLTRAIADKLLDLTARILHKRRDLMAIAVDYVPAAQWVVGGTTLAEQRKNSFYLDIKIVDGSNTKTEKAQYIAEVFSAFRELLGDLHEESYIHVHDVRADAYGFGGRTQEYRYIKDTA
jgi:4-oxalocrotonate tautomerase